VCVCVWRGEGFTSELGRKSLCVNVGPFVGSYTLRLFATIRDL